MPSYKNKLLGLIVLFLSFFLVLPSGVHGQYFGRNKVQYKTFHFKVMTTDHFNIYYYTSEEIIKDFARMAERWYDRYSKFFDYKFDDKNPIIVYASDADFQQTNVVEGLIGEGTGGVTEGMKKRVVLPLSGSYRDIDHVIGHELVHVFQYRISGESPGNTSSTIESSPLWYIEGMAEYLSIGRYDPQTAMWLRDSDLYNDLPTIKKLSSETRYFPYRWGQAFWGYVSGTWGDDMIPKVFKKSVHGGWESALNSQLAIKVDTLSTRWKGELRSTYAPQIEDRTPPVKIGKRILVRSNMNLAPSISPDGTTVAFLSQQDVFTIDLFLADAKTGKIKNKLSSSDRDRHFDALRFIDSSGTWSPDGKKFAYVVFNKGNNDIAIFNVMNGDIVDMLHFHEIDTITNPSWSPDGKTIAFSGAKGGIIDLYVYDMQNHELKQLTSDRYADMQPTWSPDGSTLAFVTDRGKGTDFDLLTYGPMKIGLYTLSSGSIRLISLFEDVLNTNPQFSPDGKSLYFIAYHQGFPEVYRTVLDTGEIFQVTRIATGIAGITPLSPAMTVSKGNGMMVFSIFQKSNYQIYQIDPSKNQETPVGERTENTPSAGIIPPINAEGKGKIYDYHNDPATGLPKNTNFKEANYHPSLKLDYIGQPSIGITTDYYGTSLGGGGGALFSDVLGNHVLGFDIQANGAISNVGGDLFYMNRDNRWNYGFVGSRIPYFSSNIVTQSGAAADSLTQSVDLVFVNQLQFTTSYPLSPTRRFEFTAGPIIYDFQRQQETLVFNSSGQILTDSIQNAKAPSPLKLFQTSLGYIGDNSYFGYTSPVRGWRYDYEINPTWGTLDFEEVYLDYRHYFFSRNASLAFRLLHYGRYGKNSDDSRISPLFLGYGTIIRGYEPGSFNFSSFGPDSTGAFPGFDRLVGSRIAAANVELRIPLFGSSAYGIFSNPLLPMEIAPFFDAGLAWTSKSSPTVGFFSRNNPKRIPVFSTGMTTRFNIFGFVVLEAYYAYPFQHPQKRGHFGFQIAPGW
jgi:hypothetical protein